MLDVTSRRKRPGVFPLLIGLAAGLLLAGVALPLAIQPKRTTTSGVAAVTPTPPAAIAGTESTVAEAAGGGQVSEGTATTGGNGALAHTTGAGPTGGSATASGTGATGSGARAAAAATQAGEASTTSVPLRATDQGVTATSIRVGFLLLDLGGAAKFGFQFPGVDPAQQQKAFQAYVDDINHRGGIAGRMIEPFYRTFDVLSQDDQRAACLQMARDNKVFMVIAQSGFRDAAMLCVTQENATPLIAMGESTSNEFIQQSVGRMFILSQVGNRLMANWVAELDALGVLKGKRIGIVDDEESSYAVTDGGLIPTLTQYGYTVTHRSRLSADLSTGAGQIPVEVQQMRAKNVDVVLLNTQQLYDAQWANAADAQGWKPQYTTSDWDGMATDGDVANMPASFDGAYALTFIRIAEWRANIPEPPTDAACRQLYEKATGEQLSRNDGAKDNATYNVTMSACNMTHMLEVAGRATGPELTKTRFSAAMQSLGDFASARFMGGSFRAGKFDLPDVGRMLQFHVDCKCFKVAGPAHRSKY